MNLEETAQTLKEMGLTQYESSAYLALTQETEATAVEISQRSKIPLTRVYGTLDQLVRKGLIKTVSGRPRRYQATAPNNAIQGYIAFLKAGFDEKTEKVQAAAHKLLKQIEPIYWKAHLRVKPEELLEPLTTLEEMMEKTKNMITSSEREVLVSTALFSWLPDIRKELEQAAGHKVKVKVLMQVANEKIKRQAENLVRKGITVKDTVDPWHPVRGTLVDDKALVFVIWASEEQEKHWYPIIYRPHYTQNPGLIRIFRESFENRWNKAKPL